MESPNQIDPYGKAHRIPGHRAATFTGNSFFGNSRIICDIDRKWRKEGRIYLRLFFLDEATALAAGFRPCNRCRRKALKSYLEGWNSSLSVPEKTEQVNQLLKIQQGRLTDADANDLPDGAMVDLSGRPFLILNGRMHRWSFDGYGEAKELPAERVGLITPTRTVDVLRDAYDVNIHQSAFAA